MAAGPVIAHGVRVRAGLLATITLLTLAAAACSPSITKEPEEKRWCATLSPYDGYRGCHELLADCEQPSMPGITCEHVTRPYCFEHAGTFRCFSTAKVCRDVADAHKFGDEEIPCRRAWPLEMVE